MKISFTVTWKKDSQAGIPRGTLALTPDPEDVSQLGKFLQANDGKPLQCDLSTVSRGRSIDSNRLMWSLYRIEAIEHNGGKLFGAVTPEKLYEADLLQTAPRATITIDPITAVSSIERETGWTQNTI